MGREVKLLAAVAALALALACVALRLFWVALAWTREE